MTQGRALREVLYEFVTVGGYVKVTAVDADSGTEVSIVGSPRAGERVLKDTARRKLDYVLERERRRTTFDDRLV